MTAAWTHPVEFVRVVASLIPRELEATITTVTERMSDAQLDALIGRCIEGGLDPAATDYDAQINSVDRRGSRRSSNECIQRRFFGGKADMPLCTAYVCL